MQTPAAHDARHARVGHIEMYRATSTLRDSNLATTHVEAPSERVPPAESQSVVAPGVRTLVLPLESKLDEAGQAEVAHRQREHLTGRKIDRIPPRGRAVLDAAARTSRSAITTSGSAAFGVLTPVVAVLPLALLLSLAAAAGAATRAAAATGDDRSRIHAGNGDHVGGGCGAHGTRSELSGRG